MGRLIGRRPDPTAPIARRARRHLAPGERVLAGVPLQTPGTNAAAISGAASGAVGATVGLPPSFVDQADARSGDWARQVAAAGIDWATARRMVWVTLVLTSSRLLVIRRSRLTGRLRELVIAWPITEIGRIEVPRNGDNLTIHRANLTLRFELPLAHKFLPEVYRELPDRLALAQRHVCGS